MANLQFYKGNTAPTDAEKGSIWFDEKEKKIKVKDTDGWVSYADSNIIEHIFVGDIEYPAKSIDTTEKAVQIPASPYELEYDETSEAGFMLLGELLGTVYDAHLEGKNTIGINLSDKLDALNYLLTLPPFIHLPEGSMEAFFYINNRDGKIRITCIPGLAINGDFSHNLSTITFYFEPSGAGEAHGNNLTLLSTFKESPYLVTQEDNPEIYTFFNTFLVNVAQASSSGKTTTSYEISSSDQSTIFEKIVEIPKCFILDGTSNLGVFFGSKGSNTLYINCLPGHYIMGNKSYKLAAATAAIGGRIVDINIYKNFTPTTSGDGTKYLNDKGEYNNPMSWAEGS